MNQNSAQPPGVLHLVAMREKGGGIGERTDHTDQDTEQGSVGGH